MKQSRAKQLLGAISLVLCTLTIVGLCTNTLVLPYVNLSGAIANKTQNVVPVLDKSHDNPATPALSFLQMLEHFSVSAGAGKVLSGEEYDRETDLILANVSKDVLPAVGTVDGHAALQARMGFLVRRNADGSRTLMDENGAVLVEKMPDELDLVGQWDSRERAVFTSADGYVYYDRATQTFEKSDYQPRLSAVSGVDLPVYYERPDSRIALSYKDGLYGYFYTDTGEPNYQYAHAGQSYQFREGYGALGTDSGILIVNYVARRYFTSWGTLVQPEGEGVEKLGYYRMDHGLILLCRKTDAGVEKLVLTEGERVVYLPRDFRMVCYTDGVFLMEKDGRYGYLDYTGRWIASPVYKDATPFKEGLGILTREDGKKGVVDTAGTFVVPCEFDEITFGGGVMTLYSSGRWVVVHKVAPEKVAAPPASQEDK